MPLRSAALKGAAVLTVAAMGALAAVAGRIIPPLETALAAAVGTFGARTAVTVTAPIAATVSIAVAAAVATVAVTTATTTVAPAETAAVTIAPGPCAHLVVPIASSLATQTHGREKSDRTLAAGEFLFVAPQTGLELRNPGKDKVDVVVLELR